MAVSALDLVRSVGMCDRPNFYSGRGAISCDLNGEMLYKIHQRIRREIGENQAKAFVSMVKSLRTLSATNFLNALYFLEYHQWVYDYSYKENDIDLGPDGPAKNVIALGSIFSSLLREGRDETQLIRDSFFRLNSSR